MSAWALIEFAPKDGTVVDLWVMRGKESYRLPDCRYIQVDSTIWKREGWFVEAATGDASFWLNDSFGTPTHYSLPLPGPNI